MSIDFFLMGKKGLRVLEHLCTSPYKNSVHTVVLARDSAMEEDYVDEMEAMCKANAIPYADRKAYTGKADYRILAGWRWMAEADNTIVLHDALLPAYRGFAPLVNALINGEKEIGMTAIWAAGEYDKGPIIVQKKAAVNGLLRIADALDIISGLYAAAIEEILPLLAEGKRPAGTAQDETKASYSLWRDDADYFIDWTADSSRILRSIYALGFPFKGACSLLNGEKIIIQDAMEVPDLTIVDRQTGKVIFVEDGFPVVVCGRGLLKITAAVAEGSADTVLPLAKFRSRFSSPRP